MGKMMGAMFRAAGAAWRGLAVLAIAGSLATAAEAKKAKVGEPAPKFTLVTYEGDKIEQESLRGKVVVLNYWATWCAPCLKEMPLFNVFQRRLRDHGLAIYAVATEDSVPPKHLKKIKDQFEFTMVRSLRGLAYGILGGVPTSYVIDRNGIVRYAKAGAFDLDTLNALLLPLLREAPPAD